MVDATEQRQNMVASQVRPSEISDRRIIRAMEEIPREAFLPQSLSALAYADAGVPLRTKAGEAPRFELAPRVLAKLVQAADIDETDVVLAVAAGSGYGAAVIAQLCETVIALEEQANLAQTASDTMSDLGIDTVAVVTGPLEAGYEKSGLYDVIVVQGGVGAAPETLLSQLQDGGRLVAILQDGSGVGQACCWRSSGATYSKRVCFDASAHVLPAFARVPQFSL